MHERASHECSLLQQAMACGSTLPIPRSPPSGLFAANMKRSRGMPEPPQLLGSPPVKLLACRYLQRGGEMSRAVARMQLAPLCTIVERHAHSSWRSVMAAEAPHREGSVPLMLFLSRASTESCGNAPGVPHCSQQLLQVSGGCVLLSDGADGTSSSHCLCRKASHLLWKCACQAVI